MLSRTDEEIEHAFENIAGVFLRIDEGLIAMFDFKSTYAADSTGEILLINLDKDWETRLIYVSCLFPITYQHSRYLMRNL